MWFRHQAGRGSDLSGQGQGFDAGRLHPGEQVRISGRNTLYTAESQQGKKTNILSKIDQNNTNIIRIHK